MSCLDVWTVRYIQICGDHAKPSSDIPERVIK